MTSGLTPECGTRALRKGLRAGAVFYDAAVGHTDPHLRDITWNTENAVLALGTAASLAQVILAHA